MTFPRVNRLMCLTMIPMAIVLVVTLPLVAAVGVDVGEGLLRADVTASPQPSQYGGAKVEYTYHISSTAATGFTGAYALDVGCDPFRPSCSIYYGLGFLPMTIVVGTSGDDAYVCNEATGPYTLYSNYYEADCFRVVTNSDGACILHDWTRSDEPWWRFHATYAGACLRVRASADPALCAEVFGGRLGTGLPEIPSVGPLCGQSPAVVQDDGVRVCVRHRDPPPAGPGTLVCVNR